LHPDFARHKHRQRLLLHDSLRPLRSAHELLLPPLLAEAHCLGRLLQ
jgi:hypothetical protein